MTDTTKQPTKLTSSDDTDLTKADLATLLDTHIKWERSFVDVTQTAREKSETDRNFYDGIQWTPAEEQDLIDRGQPVVTINRIASKTNYAIGSEINTRTDPRAYPKNPSLPQVDDEAIAITDAIRHVCDNNDFDRIASEVFEFESIEGYGGAIVELDKQTKDIMIRCVEWDRILFDPHSRHSLFEDARYRGIVVWWDYDQALRSDLYGDTQQKRDVLAATKSNTGGEVDDRTHDDKPRWYDSDRDRVKIVELYYRVGRDWWVAHYTRSGYLIEPKKLKLRTDRGRPFCPLLLVSAYTRRGPDQNNARYGIVRHMISPQEEINKRRSKALHLLSLRQAMYEEDFVEDIREFMQELSQPDGAMKVRQDALKEKRVEVLQTTDLAQGQFQLLQDAQNNIDRTGPDASLVASDQRQMSGRLFLARQQAGQMELGRVFDNFRAWKKEVYKTVWYFIKMFWTEEKWFRVRDSAEKEGYKFVGINRRMTRAQRFADLMSSQVPFETSILSVGIPPTDAQTMLQQVQQQAQQMAQMAQQQGQQMTPEQGQQISFQLVTNHPFMQEQYVQNDISQIDVDITIDVVPDTSVIQHEQFELILQLLQTKPDLPIPADLLIEMSDLRDKKRILAGMKQPDPMQQQMQQMQLQSMQAQLQKIAADVQLIQAKAAKTVADAQLAIPAEAEKDKAQAVKAAAEAGEKLDPDALMGPQQEQEPRR